MSMTVKQHLQRYLAGRGWKPGEINAANIYKGHGFSGYGWYVVPFGENPIWMGADLEDIKEKIKDDL